MVDDFNIKRSTQVQQPKKSRTTSSAQSVSASNLIPLGQPEGKKEDKYLGFPTSNLNFQSLEEMKIQGYKLEDTEIINLGFNFYLKVELYKRRVDSFNTEYVYVTTRSKREDEKSNEFTKCSIKDNEELDTYLQERYNMKFEDLSKQLNYNKERGSFILALGNEEVTSTNEVDAITKSEYVHTTWLERGEITYLDTKDLSEEKLKSLAVDVLLSGIDTAIEILQQADDALSLADMSYWIQGLAKAINQTETQYLPGENHLSEYTQDNISVENYDEAIQKLKSLRARAQKLLTEKDPEKFNKIYKSLTNVEYNAESVRAYAQSVSEQDGEKIKKTYTNAFGTSNVLRAHINTEANTKIGEAMDLMTMLMGTEAIGKGLGKYVFKGLTTKALSKGMLYRAFVSGLQGGTTMSTWEFAKGTIKQLTDNRENDWSEVFWGTVGGFGIGVTGGIFGSTVTPTLIKVIDKPMARSVMNTLAKEGSADLDVIMENYLTMIEKGGSFTTKATNFALEVLTVTGYSIIVNSVSRFIQNGEFSKDAIIEYLTSAHPKEYKKKDLENKEIIDLLEIYLGVEFKDQLKGLGEIKTVANLLMMMRGGHQAQKMMIDMQKNAAKAVLNNISVEQRVDNGNITYIVTDKTTGKMALAKTPEEIIDFGMCAITQYVSIKQAQEIYNDLSEDGKTILQNLKLAKSEEDFAKIKEAISKLPKGKEKKNLINEYEAQYKYWKENPQVKEAKKPELKPTPENDSSTTTETKTKISSAIGEDGNLVTENGKTVFKTKYGDRYFVEQNPDGSFTINSILRYGNETEQRTIIIKLDGTIEEIRETIEFVNDIGEGSWYVDKRTVRIIKETDGRKTVLRVIDKPARLSDTCEHHVTNIERITSGSGISGGHKASIYTDLIKSWEDGASLDVLAKKLGLQPGKLVSFEVKNKTPDGFGDIEIKYIEGAKVKVYKAEFNRGKNGDPDYYFQYVDDGNGNLIPLKDRSNANVNKSLEDDATCAKMINYFKKNGFDIDLLDVGNKLVFKYNNCYYEIDIGVISNNIFTFYPISKARVQTYQRDLNFDIDKIPELKIPE